MVEEMYCAPKEEVIMGKFLEQIVPTEVDPRPKKKSTTSTTEKLSKCWKTSHFCHKDSPRIIVMD